MNPLILIKSCNRYADRRQAQRDTWIPLLPWDHRFVVGAYSDERDIKKEEDVLVTGSSDSFDSIAPKLCTALSEEKNKFRFVLVCDDDTYIHVPRLVAMARKENFYTNYLGWFREDGGALYPLPYIQGSCYWLSPVAVKYVVESGAMVGGIPDDVAVGRALHGKVKFDHDPRFYPGPDCWQQYPSTENELISTHKCNPRRMLEMHEKCKNLSI